MPLSQADRLAMLAGHLQAVAREFPALMSEQDMRQLMLAGIQMMNEPDLDACGKCGRFLSSNGTCRFCGEEPSMYWIGKDSLDASPHATDVMGDWHAFIMGLDSGDEEYAWCVRHAKSMRMLDEFVVSAIRRLDEIASHEACDVEY